MSRGYWDYSNESLKNKIFGYNNEIDNPLGNAEMSDIVKDVFDVLYAADSYFSGDCGKEEYSKEIGEALGIKEPAKKSAIRFFED